MKIKPLTLLVILLFFAVSYADVPYKTYTMGPNGFIVETRNAFVPEKVFFPSVMNAEDIFVDKDGSIYVADTGNMRVLKINPDMSEEVFSDYMFFMPTGIFVTDELVYVADSGSFSVCVFNKSGELLKELGRPSQPLFGSKNQFIPLKVAVDARNNIYIISEGSTDGIVCLNSDGEFMNYLGANRPDVSLKMLLQRIIFTGAKGQFLKLRPPSPTNIAIDADGIIYTCTYGLETNSIKKFNIAGVNIFENRIFGDPDIVDIGLDDLNNVYAVDSNGFIVVSNSLGDLLFIFGNKDSLAERKGLLTNPSALEVAGDGRVYVLDKEKNSITVFKPTDFADLVFRADNMYIQGLYLQGKDEWQKVQTLNSSFLLSYKALAKAYFKEGMYGQSLEYFRLSQDKGEYSESFWQIRNEWLQKNLSLIFIGFVAVFILYKLLRFIDRKKNIFSSLKLFFVKLSRVKLINDLLFLKYMLFHPIDGYYEIRRKNRISLVSATVLYIYLFFLELFKIFFTGFIFSSVSVYRVNLFEVAAGIYLPVAVLLLSNYLISEINSGEGRLRDIYTAGAYALAPYIVFEPFLIIISNVLTYNEAFLYTFPQYVVIGWTLILLFLMVKQIHNYTVGEAVKNILLTLFMVFIIIIIVFIIFVLFTQEAEFLQSIFREVILRE